jgi:hypothetical protein
LFAFSCAKFTITTGSGFAMAVSGPHPLRLSVGGSGPGIGPRRFTTPQGPPQGYRT